jgi:hypothetical protein
MEAKTKRIVRAVLILPFIAAAWLFSGTLAFAISGSSGAAWIAALIGEVLAAVGYILWMRRNPILDPPASRSVLPDAAWIPGDSAASRNELLPLVAFGPCPRCGVLAHHLLSAPRVHVEDASPDPWGTHGVGIPMWKVAAGNVWAVSGARRTVQSDATRHRVEEKPSVTVIDRECLSCGKTWMETP